MSEQIEVEVAYATPEEQVVIKFSAEKGMDAKAAIVNSRITEKFPEIDPENAKVGIFGKAIKLDHVMCTGDRLEIYRELIADPKAARKKKAGDKDKAKAKPKAEKKEEAAAEE